MFELGGIGKKCPRCVARGAIPASHPHKAPDPSRLCRRQPAKLSSPAQRLPGFDGQDAASIPSVPSLLGGIARMRGVPCPDPHLAGALSGTSLAPRRDPAPDVLPEFRAPPERLPDPAPGCPV